MNGMTNFIWRNGKCLIGNVTYMDTLEHCSVTLVLPLSTPYSVGGEVKTRTLACLLEFLRSDSSEDVSLGYFGSKRVDFSPFSSEIL